MNVYRRFFDVTGGPLYEALSECERVNAAAREEYRQILARVGAKLEYYQNRNRLVGLIFDSAPDKSGYRRVGGTRDGWYPKLSSKGGKALAKEFEAVQTREYKDCLPVVGLSGWSGVHDDGRVYFVSVTAIPSDRHRFFLVVPWYDADPEEVTKYRREKEGSCRRDSNLDAVMWEPPAELVELKEWEVQRAITEWNESVREAP